MSFKRVADDFDDFKLQKKRRVNDLLLDAIPSDEAILIKNGKLACLVCSHRPVFDTTAMLSIHRKGKKHLASSLIKLERAKEDAEIRQKREQESFLKMKQDVPTNPLLGLTKMKKEQALNESLQNHSFNECTSGQEGDLIPKQDTNMPFFGKKTGFSSEKSYGRSTTSSCVSRKSSASREKNFEATKKNNSKREKFLSVNPLTKQKITQRESKNPVSHCRSMEDTKLNQSNRTTFGASETSNSSIPNRASSSTFFSHDQHSTLNNLDANSKAQYLSKLRQIGWILGTDGKWEKDENAEFESDEDEPPSPRTILFG